MKTESLDYSNAVHKIIRENIKRIRIEKGLNVLALSKRCGITHPVILRIEKQQEGNSIMLQSLIMVASGLEVSLFDLLEGIPKRNNYINNKERRQTNKK